MIMTMFSSLSLRKLTTPRNVMDAGGGYARQIAVAAVVFPYFYSLSGISCLCAFDGTVDSVGVLCRIHPFFLVFYIFYFVSYFAIFFARRFGREIRSRSRGGSSRASTARPGSLSERPQPQQRQFRGIESRKRPRRRRLR